jgi:hypothetical protein
MTRIGPRRLKQALRVSYNRNAYWPGRGPGPAADSVDSRDMSQNFERAERTQIEAALEAGETLTCPSCHAPLDRTMIPPRTDVSYVRRRVWLTCGSCNKSLVLDQPKAK